MKRKFIYLITLLLIITLSSCRVKNTNPSNSSTTVPPISTSEDTLKQKSLVTSKLKIGQSFELLGKTKRTLPTKSDEGLSRYPTFGTSLPDITDEEKTNLINESLYLKSSDTTYDKIDSDGNLYLNNEKLDRKLYMHTAASSMFYGCPDDNEDAVIKKITVDPRERGNHITGLYAPAGEIIKVEISDEDLKKTGGIKIEIGQFSQNNQLNNIWEARNDFCRMPHIGNEMEITEATSYVGAFLGGPIYVTPNKPVKFSVTISGALEYCHFIYGLTTREEFERLSKTSAPYFDLEVWDACVRHSGPKAYANLDYDNLNRISEFWLATSSISRQVPSGSSTSIGINFIYDPFVCAGAACALVGRNWCNLPVSWMEGSLNYDSFTQIGSWGTIHEYNHHFQRYGFAPGDEVTNNAINLLSYINNTNISSARSQGLSGWNRYLDPEVCLKETLSLSKNGDVIQSLPAYADIIHTFGVDAFLKATAYKKGAGGVDAWYESLCEATGYQMTYYFEKILNQKVSDGLKTKYSNLKEFIPATIKYQTGRQINDKKIITVKPYVIPYQEEITIDFSSILTIPEGFEYSVKKVSNPKSGKITKNNDIYTYTPGNDISSGEFTVKINVSNGTINQDLDFILEFKQDYLGIDAKRYTYSSDIYSDAKEALENNFVGYTDVKSEVINKHFVNRVKNKEIYTYNGKIYIEKDGNYKFGVRTSSRSNTYIEFSHNNKNYADKINSLKSSPVDYNTSNVSYDCKKGDYVYFRITIQSFHPDAYAEVFSSYNGSTMTSLNTRYLYNTNSLGYKSYIVNDQYPKKYSASSVSCELKNQKVVSYTESYSAWDDTLLIDNIIDGDSSTSYHSVKNKMISSEPFELTIDLGKINCVDTLNILGYNGNQMHMPNTFKLYGGTTLENMTELGDYKDVEYSGRNLTVSFNKTDIRYYKLVITNTSNKRYVALTEINMSLSTTGELKAPSYASYYVKNSTNFEALTQISTFGSVIKGNGTIKLSASGSSFGLFTSNTKDAKIKITIDGVSKEINISNGYKNLALYEILPNTEVVHQITIEVISGEIIIDSFIL